MKRTRLPHLVALLLFGAASAPRPALALFTFEFIDGGYATGLSADGAVVVGNTAGDFETFRWTPGDGLVRLGRGTVGVLGTGGGTPGVSDDGTRVCATILGADSTYSTQGLWIQGSGWQELMPPTPPDGGLLDQSYGSAWAVSGDGSSVIGLYWRPGAPGGSAHATRWTAGSGVVDLGSGGRSSRASGVNQDGTVVVGFDEHAVTGVRVAAVWVNGVKTIIDPAPDGVSEANGVNAAGTRVVGRTYDPVRTYPVATLWRKLGGVWSPQRLGALPGTMPSPGFGLSTARDVSADGSVVVGYNRFNQPWEATGFIWTQPTGMVDVVDYLASHGVVLTNFDVLDLTAVSDDGETMVGYGQDTVAPFLVRSFIIRTDVQTSVAAGAAPAPSSSLDAVPNPTAGSTTIAFELSAASRAELAVFDVTGRAVRRLFDGDAAEGPHRFGWDGLDAAGSRVPSGLYYARLTAGARSETRKIIVTR